MAFQLADRTQETTATTGTGAFALGGAVTNYQPFSASMSNGDTTVYACVDSTNNAWEVGLGTYGSSGSTLTRTTVYASSNSGAIVSFAAGTKNVFMDVAAAAIKSFVSGNTAPSVGQVPAGNGAGEYAPTNINATFTYTAASGAWTATLNSSTAMNVFHVVTANNGETSAVITMPATAFDQQKISINTNTATTMASVTFSPNAGQTISGVALTEILTQNGVNGTGSCSWVYQAAASTWLRVQ